VDETSDHEGSDFIPREDEGAVLHLVRFGELALKSRYVRRQLQDRLVSNIEEMFLAERRECLVTADFGRIYVRADDDALARSVLARTFGVVSFSPVAETPSELASLCLAAGEYAKPLLKAGMSFAIRARRAGTHPYTSQDVGREAGSAVWNAVPGLRVDLTNPDREIFIEVRENKAYLFHEVLQGPGGLPLGTQGRAVALVETERDLAAAWLLMRRGARTTIATTGEESMAAPLRRWDVRLKVQRIEALADLAEVVRASRAQALGLPWGVDRVGSREKLQEIGGEAVVFFPLAGMSEDEVARVLGRVRI